LPFSFNEQRALTKIGMCVHVCEKNVRLLKYKINIITPSTLKPTKMQKKRHN